MWVLGTEAGSSQEQPVPFKAGAIPEAHETDAFFSDFLFPLLFWVILDIVST